MEEEADRVGVALLCGVEAADDRVGVLLTGVPADDDDAFNTLLDAGGVVFKRSLNSLPEVDASARLSLDLDLDFVAAGFLATVS